MNIMNIIKRIKSLFKGKKINQEIQEETNIVGFDISHIFLPKIKDLSIEDQELVKRYQNEINIEKFKSLLDYVKRISDESQLVTNLLIEYIYEYDQHTLKVKTSPDDKTMNEERINLLFLNQKINLLKGELKKLKKESILKTISLQEVLKFESKRICDFLGIFGFASKIKRENLKRSLSDAINNMKITIITINQQIMAINNALENAYQTINSIDNFNIVENEKTKLIKQEIYLKKITITVNTFENLYLLGINFLIPYELEKYMYDFSLENEIELMKKEYADLQVKEGKIENGDTAVIDFEGFDGDKAFDGGKGENYPLEIGSHSFIPGFEEALIGLKAGDKKDVEVSFPEDYHAEELKGKPVVFKVTVNEVKTKVYPELNEDFFLDLGFDDVKTEEDLKKTVKQNLTEAKEYEVENKYIDDLFDALLKQTTVEIPHELVHEEIDQMIMQYEERLKMQGLTLEQFYKYTNSSKEALEAQMHEEAEKRIKLRFAIDEIIKLEKIEASEEEANKDAEEKAKKHNISTEEYVKAFGGIEMIKYDVMVSKVLEILKK